MMSIPIRARIKGGMIELLEQVDFPEGQDIMITIISPPSNLDSEAFRNSAGRWQCTMEADTLIRNIYTDRLLSPRPIPTL